MFHIFQLAVNQRPETVTLLPSGLMYLLLCFLCKVSIHHLLYVCLTFDAKELMSLENFCFVYTYKLLIWRSIVTWNQCNIMASHKCLTCTNQTFCTMSFNSKLIKVFGGNILKLRAGPCLFYFCVDIAWILKLAPY